MDLRHVFGFSREPFAQDLKVQELYPIPGLKALTERFLYAVHLGLVMVVTGEVGTGKSTSLRYASSGLHPAEYRIVSVIATGGTLLDLLRQICLEFGSPARSSLAVLTRNVRELLLDIRLKKQIPLLVVDEAQLLRLEVFAQLHTLSQYQFDSQTLMPMVLSGQNGLLDKLLFHTSRPFASRVVGRSHLEGLKLKDMQGYLSHHLELAGGSQRLLSEEAVVAIHQGSGGLLRRANSLARGALVAAARESCQVVSAEHVRLASTEIL
jgi:general secretion pathway protein A